MAEFKAALLFVSTMIDPLLMVFWIVQGFFFGFALSLFTAIFWLINEVLFNRKYNLTIVKVSAVYLLIWLVYMAISFVKIFYF